MTNNKNSIPYMRKKISSTLLVFSAAIILLLTSPLLPLSNFLLQPAQAQTTVTFKTPTNTPATNPNEGWTLTFDVQGTACSSYCNQGRINSGTFQFNDSTPYSDDSDSGKLSNAITSYFTNDSSGVTIVAYYDGTTRNPTIYYQITTACSTSDDNSISINEQGPDGYGPQYTLNGAVECTIGGGNTAAEPSSSSPSPSLTVSPQGTDRGGSSSSNSTDSNSGSSSSSNGKDSDSDGIPDSSDNCPNHSHHRCFKEGDTGTTSTDDQQPSSSSSSGNGNQTG